MTEHVCDAACIAGLTPQRPSTQMGRGLERVSRWGERVGFYAPGHAEVIADGLAHVETQAVRNDRIARLMADKKRGAA